MTPWLSVVKKTILQQQRPLKYASAEDRQIKYREDDIQAPGVATILANVLGDANVVSVDGQANGSRAPLRSGRAVIQAEPSLNAIVVRDSAERMPMYKRLIEALDRRDPAAMRTVLLAHLQNKRAVVMEQLRSAQQSAKA